MATTRIDHNLLEIFNSEYEIVRSKHRPIMSEASIKYQIARYTKNFEALSTYKKLFSQDEFNKLANTFQGLEKIHQQFKIYSYLPKTIAALEFYLLKLSQIARAATAKNPEINQHNFLKNMQASLINLHIINNTKQIDALNHAENIENKFTVSNKPKDTQTSSASKAIGISEPINKTTSFLESASQAETTSEADKVEPINFEQYLQNGRDDPALPDISNSPEHNKPHDDGFSYSMTPTDLSMPPIDMQKNANGELNESSLQKETTQTDKTPILNSENLREENQLQSDEPSETKIEIEPSTSISNLESLETNAASQRALQQTIEPKVEKESKVDENPTSPILEKSNEQCISNQQSNNLNNLQDHNSNEVSPPLPLTPPTPPQSKLHLSYYQLLRTLYEKVLAILDDNPVSIEAKKIAANTLIGFMNAINPNAINHQPDLQEKVNKLSENLNILRIYDGLSYRYNDPQKPWKQRILTFDVFDIIASTLGIAPDRVTRLNNTLYGLKKFAKGHTAEKNDDYGTQEKVIQDRALRVINQVTDRIKSFAKLSSRYEQDKEKALHSRNIASADDQIKYINHAAQEMKLQLAIYEQFVQNQDCQKFLGRSASQHQKNQLASAQNSLKILTRLLKNDFRENNPEIAHFTHTSFVIENSDVLIKEKIAEIFKLQTYSTDHVLNLTNSSERYEQVITPEYTILQSKARISLLQFPVKENLHFDFVAVERKNNDDGYILESYLSPDTINALQQKSSLAYVRLLQASSKLVDNFIANNPKIKLHLDKRNTPEFYEGPPIRINGNCSADEVRAVMLACISKGYKYVNKTVHVIKITSDEFKKYNNQLLELAPNDEEKISLLSTTEISKLEQKTWHPEITAADSLPRPGR